jgi:hypothetical protein
VNITLQRVRVRAPTYHMGGKHYTDTQKPSAAHEKRTQNYEKKC